MYLGIRNDLDRLHDPVVRVPSAEIAQTGQQSTQACSRSVECHRPVGENLVVIGLGEGSMIGEVDNQPQNRG